LIKRIQKRIDAKLITYISNPQHPFAQIMKQDTPLFEDLLRSVSGAEEGYLMINCPGGDPNAAEKLLVMCRERFAKQFNVIVPDFAKSAATMIALGSDKILMGYLAELGPIDPQLQVGPLPMTGQTIPARSFIDGLDMIRKRIKEERDPPHIYLPMLSQIRPELIAICQRAIEDSQAFAEKWLKQHMLKDAPEQATMIAKLLSSGEKSHGKVIDFTEAKDVLKLNVEKIDKNSELWNEIWELYCRSIQFLSTQHAAAKLFESETVSLTMSIEAVIVEGRRPPPTAPMRGPPPATPSPE